MNNLLARHTNINIYTLDSTREGVYTVDLSISKCSRISWNTGSIYEHQIATLQFSAIHLPQIYAFSPVEKRHFYKVIYGDKENPTSTFF